MTFRLFDERSLLLRLHRLRYLVDRRLLKPSAEYKAAISVAYFSAVSLGPRCPS